MGERWYRQEYECSFEDVVGSLFSPSACLLRHVAWAGTGASQRRWPTRRPGSGRVL